MNGLKHISISPMLAIHENITYCLITKDQIKKDHNGNAYQILIEI